jgi:hypothetical protein
MRRGELALIALCGLIAGCPPPAGQPPTCRREALERVNNNLAGLHEPLQCSALVSFQFRDSKGKLHQFIGYEARLFYRPTQSLLFDVRSLAGTVAQFGSNDERYWVWVDVPDVRKLWWGTWERASLSSARELPVPPNELLDALMLRPLPESLDGGQLPLLRVEGDDHRLVYVRLGAGGQPAGWREVRLDPHAPYQPLEIIDRLPDGELVMHAQLRDYRRIGADGPLTPRRYVVRWPPSDAEMRLDILSAKSRSDLPGEVFEFPAGWQGEIEQIGPSAEAAAGP